MIDEVLVTMHPAIKYDKGVEFFRGVDFHMAVLQNRERILKLIPSLKHFIPQLESLEDSIRLGQLMLYTEVLQKAIKHPNYIVPEGTQEHKFPKYLADDLPVFAFDGFYTVTKEEDEKA